MVTSYMCCLFQAKIMCSGSCKCVGCKNFEESPERKTLMHLADAAEVRVLQQTAAKSKLSSQISDLPSRPVSSVTGERCTLLNMKCSAFLSPYATTASNFKSHTVLTSNLTPLLHCCHLFFSK